jgi:hypothetical protein
VPVGVGELVNVPTDIVSTPEFLVIVIGDPGKEIE